jgi:CARDB
VIVAIGAGAVCVALADPSPAARSRPDLVVSGLRKAPKTLVGGKAKTLKVKVSNAGRVSAHRSKVRVYLGWDRRLELGRMLRVGTGSVPRLGPRRSRTVKLRMRVPLTVAERSGLYLVACADDTKRVRETKERNNCGGGHRVAVRQPPTVFGAIDRDEARGRINHLTALRYYAYASAGDPRLPSHYGKPEKTFDSAEGLDRIAAEWRTLSPAAKDTFDPFFRPPLYAGAYLPKKHGREIRSSSADPPGCATDGAEPQTVQGLASIETLHFRIWYFTSAFAEAGDQPTSPAASRATAEWLAGVAEDVYAAETAIWRAPLSDAGLACNGGDGLIDVYALRLSFTAKSAQVVPYPPGENLRPGWMWVAPDFADDQQLARSTFAHEFAHLTQLAYYESANPPHGTRIEYGWLEEASATWAMDFVYPQDDVEHLYASRYYAFHAWLNPLGECERYGCGNGYRDYLYFFFLTHYLGGTSVMTDVWKNVERYGSIQSVDHALGGRFGQLWSKFALYDMNANDYKHYKPWDGIANVLPLDEGPRFKVELEGKSISKRPYPFADTGGTGIDPKSFDWVNFEFPDDKVRQVTLKDFGYQTQEGAVPTADSKVIAWYELKNGQHRTEDWTDLDQRSFCRDDRAENVTKLTVFYTQGQPLPYLDRTRLQYPKPTGKVIAKRHCVHRYAIHVDFKTAYPAPIPDESYTFDGKLNMKDPTGACGQDCEPLKGVGSWKGTQLTSTRCGGSTPKVKSVKGKATLLGNFTPRDPDTDVNGDGRLGDQLFWGGQMLDGQGLIGWYIGDWPGGFFPEEGGSFTESDKVPVCGFGDATTYTRTWHYRITPIG